jgi:diguanylate cyclase (GGDEF)-like protein
LTPAAVTYLAGLGMLAVGGVLANLLVSPPVAADLPPFGLVAVCAALHAHGARSTEAQRRLLPHRPGPHVDLNAVWIFAGTLLLHPAWTALLVVGLRLHDRRRAGGARPHILAAAATTITSVSAGSLLERLLWPGPPAGVFDDALSRSLAPLCIVSAVGLTYWASQRVLTATAAAILRRPARVTMIGNWQSTGLDVAVICLGAFVALALATVPALVVLAVPAALLLHRTLLIGQLEWAARTDHKTGLANAGHWQRCAVEELRALADASVLLLDLDRFKLINDRFGHLVGDAALRAVGNLLITGVRPGDLVGRFGGEEFVVLLPDADTTRAADVAERLRARIAALPVATGVAGEPYCRVTVSIGVAGRASLRPGPVGDELTALLRAADAALYVAKQAGRDRVQTAQLGDHPRPGPSPGTAPPTTGSDDVAGKREHRPRHGR